MNYQEKYFKYKSKYFQLKGGMSPELKKYNNLSLHNNEVYHNIDYKYKIDSFLV